ncbi:MAG: GNAT family N-acetyltransferase [Bryobacteraceae bacterium]|nr:GNAT family N-acetyltransferase [Bryobacteraceae bacterium]
MTLTFRPATPSDYQRLEKLCIDSFEPITWMKRADESFGPLNGRDWRARWEARFRHAFDTQRVLVGEVDGEVVAFASGTLDEDTRLGFIDLLGVDQRYQGRGYGRQMLRGMLEWMKGQGMVHANLECLVDNEVGNNLYRAEGFSEVARSIRWFIKIP